MLKILFRLIGIPLIDQRNIQPRSVAKDPARPKGYRW
jgi:hypothetical protein